MQKFIQIPVLCCFLFITTLISCSSESLEVNEELQLEEFDTETITVVNPENKEVSNEVWTETSNWLGKMQLSNGLLESTENGDFVSLYDNALSAIAFTALKKYDKAEAIFDYFDGQIENELLKGNGGFYATRNKQGDHHDRIWMGDNAWLLIALNNYHQATGSNKYNRLSSELELWLRSLQDEDGGLFGGQNEDGTSIHKVTEGIVTAFNAVKGYDDFHKNILLYLKNERWDSNEQLLVAWPENPAYKYALDLHTLGFNTLENFPVTVLYQAERYKNTQTSTLTGEEIIGYCFDEDLDVIWLEGTAQMAVAFQNAGLESEANVLLEELEKTFIKSTTLVNAKGIPYTSNFGTTYGSEDLWDHADITSTISSSVWYLFAKLEFSPLALGKNKSIPSQDKFWNQ
ncbi:hypothetical protein [Sediminicola sp. YIK13]|uniref:hypothetical protein n=1 Tax=Sediminicola sp. YIK13 TaxID=1453352 RepID=UPI000A42A485|nr:hypothetical protein [Sediminicola sp. YIK13]